MVAHLVNNSWPRDGTVGHAAFGRGRLRGWWRGHDGMAIGDYCPRRKKRPVCATRSGALLHRVRFVFHGARADKTQVATMALGGGAMRQFSGGRGCGHPIGHDVVKFPPCCWGKATRALPCVPCIYGSARLSFMPAIGVMSVACSQRSLKPEFSAIKEIYSLLIICRECLKGALCLRVPLLQHTRKILEAGKCQLTGTL